ncbi:MAG TPA: UbiA family prenyltransferase [Gemmatimonadales bacterium]
MRDLWRLLRLPNLGIAAAGVLAGGWIALARVSLPRPLGWAALAALGLGAFANVLDDLWDEPADRINARADRPLAAGRLDRGIAHLWVFWGLVVGLAASALVGGWAVAAAAAALVVMALYAPVLKPRGLAGNVTVGVVAGFPLCFGALAVGRPGAGVVPWIIAAWLHLGREIVKDVLDLIGDRASGRRTLPVALGEARARRIAVAILISFAAVSLGLPALAGYHGVYFAAVAPALVLVALAIRALRRGAAAGASGLLKGAMVIGVAALVLGRIA